MGGLATLVLNVGARVILGHTCLDLAMTVVPCSGEHWCCAQVLGESHVP